MKEIIYNKLHNNFSIDKLVIKDQSHLHEGHAGHKPGGETHFAVEIISDDFSNMNMVSRHRLVYKVLKEELLQQVHALQLTTVTREENGSV